MESGFDAALLFAVGTEESRGQDEAAEANGPAIPLEHLVLQLRPLTLEEVEAEALRWRDELKVNLTRISKAEIASRSGPIPRLSV